jgi:hypothetical protein
MNNRIVPQANATPPVREIKIGLWGGPKSGKTTYLSALKMATLLQPDGDWSITGLEKDFPGSSTFLSINTSALRKGDFPKATTTASEYKFEISGTVSPRLLSGLPVLLRKMAGVERQVNFSLYMRDYPGIVFQSIIDIHDSMWTQLAECDGLIYLYDVGSSDDAYDYVNLASDFLWQLTDVKRRFHNKLPHFLAICLSKFDSTDVFDPLLKEGLVQQDPKDPRMTPYVTDPKKAFEKLADKLVTKTVQSLFHPQRIQYFISSSIGFYAPPNSPISLEDYWNVNNLPGGPKIRSGRNTYPVNVFTPLMWIESQVSALAKK